MVPECKRTAALRPSLGGASWPHGAHPAGSLPGERVACPTGHVRAQSAFLDSHVLLTYLPRVGLCVIAGVRLCESECVFGGVVSIGVCCAARVCGSVCKWQCLGILSVWVPQWLCVGSACVQASPCL